MGQPRPTLSEVAERAGVSVASASRALSGASASPDMLRRVTAAADDLGYAVDAAARSLKVRRTDQLVLAVADLGNPVYVQMMRAVEAVAKDAGYRLVVVATGAGTDGVLDAVRGLNRGYADGLVVVPLRITPDLLDELQRARVPVAVVGSLPPGSPFDNVRANSARGVGLVVSHLVGVGRRKVVFLNGPADTTPGAARRRGFRRAARAHHLPDAPEIEAEDFTIDAGEKAMTAALTGTQPDAVVCANDLLAVGASRALRAAGLDLPRDVAVTGMDDTELADVVSPALTSVDLGSAERGRLAAIMLIDRMREPGRPTERVTVQPRLVVRESSLAREGSR